MGGQAFDEGVIIQQFAISSVRVCNKNAWRVYYNLNSISTDLAFFDPAQISKYLVMHSDSNTSLASFAHFFMDYDSRTFTRAYSITDGLFYAIYPLKKSHLPTLVDQV